MPDLIKDRPSIFKDFRFWLLLYGLLRLYYITQPPLEIAHNWRQSTGLMVARNFYEGDPNILYPQIDNAKHTSGITGTEFPLFNYLIFLFAKVFGWVDWYGRLINLIVSTLGIYWFYRLVKAFIAPPLAFAAGFLLLNSLWFAYCRKTMPDTFSASLVLGSIWCFFQALYSPRRWHWLWGFLLVLAGLLSKIASLPLLGFLILPLLDGQLKLRKKIALSLIIALALVPVAIWYFYWVGYLNETYGLWHYYMGTDLFHGLADIAQHWPQALERFYFSAMGFVGFAFVLAGLWFIIRKRERKVAIVAGVCFALFFVFMAKAGFAFYHHNYYIMPFVPVLALLGAAGLQWLPKHPHRAVLMFLLAVETIINALPEFRINSNQRYKLTLESLTAQVAQPHERIAINCGDNPQQIYLAHRKGWELHSADAANPSYVDSLQQHGLQVLIINKHEEGWMPYKGSAFVTVLDNSDFIFYKAK